MMLVLWSGFTGEFCNLHLKFGIARISNEGCWANIISNVDISSYQLTYALRINITHVQIHSQRDWRDKAVGFLQAVKDICLSGSLLDTFVLALSYIINVHNFNNVCLEIIRRGIAKMNKPLFF